MSTWFNIKILFKYRDLLIRLAWKEVRIRYKEPILGFLWALLVPLFMSFIFMFIFSKVVKVPFGGYPFFLFLITGLFPWNFLNLSISSSTMSILESGNLIKKVYFPREIIPLSIVFANAINFIFILVVVVLFILVLGIKISPWLLLLPFAFILQVILISGLAFLISGLQVAYRDVKFIVEIILTFLFYLTPIFYPLDLIFQVSKGFFYIYILNPMVGLTVLYRISLLGDSYLTNTSSQINLVNIISISIALTLVIFLTGYSVFKKQEPIFADMVR